MLGSSCSCLSLGFVVVQRSFCSGGNLEEGAACLYSFLISSLLPKSISSQLLHYVTSLPSGSVWEWEAWRQKEGKEKNPPEFQQSASLCHWHSVLKEGRASSLPPASVLVGLCSCSFVLCWDSSLPRWARPLCHHCRAQEWGSLSCGTGAGTGRGWQPEQGSRGV